eukprot:524299_1
MLLKESSFIKDEGGAPLLMQNHFYLHKHSQIAWEKTRIWKQLLLGEDDSKTSDDKWIIVNKSSESKPIVNESKTKDKSIKNNIKQLEKYGVRIEPKPDRLIVKDAHRNFMSETRKQLLITILSALKSLFNDYQQTMASITGILLLFFDAKTAFEMMFMLGRNPKYNM